ncbi:MAG TPA: OB-fold domain-containing protein [Acidimicrobiales bacterium]|nr:OB-fold domain-containing protein [Acidimicrobiales bacterium]
MSTAEPVIEGWFTTGEEPALIGRRCPECATYQFPPTGQWCPNPVCPSDVMEEVELSRTGRVWSYTDAQYKPPAPYVAMTEPFEPFAIAAVELERERIMILGQVASGFGVADLSVGATVELVVEPLDPSGALVWKWRPVV